MMLAGRRLWWWLGLVLVVTVTAGSAAFIIYDLRTRGSATELVSALVAVATATAGAAGWLWRRAGLTGAARLPLERAADELAEQLRRQWEQAAAEQGLTYPEPIPVRWRWSPRQVTGPRTDAVARRLAPLPGMAAVAVEDLRSGALPDLLGVYGGLGSGRLVVLGEPGAGKTGAGIRLLLDALAHRVTVPAGDRARVPVPVLVTPQGWDPAAAPFAGWLADRLERDYALLQAPEYGTDAVVRLIKDGRLAVILDGLDEMPEALRPVALRALDEQVTFRLVVLTRSDELVAAVSGGHLRSSAALELLPVGPGPAAEYLASSQIDPLPTRWRHVINHLREQPEGVLAHALTTPLMLTLVRDTYGPGDEVDELIDAGRFGSEKVIEDHLLDRVLTVAYARHPGQPAPTYTVDQSRRWLGQLARRMNAEETRDLAWWRIPGWVSAWPRVLATVAIMSLVCAFLVASLSGLIAHLHLFSAFGVGPRTALTTVFARTLAYAFMVGLGLLLMSAPGAESPAQRGRPRWTRTDVLLIFLLGFGFGLMYGLLYGLLQGLKYGLATGLVSSFVVGLGVILGGGPPQRLGWLRWSRTDTHTNLRTGIVVGLVAGLVAEIGYGNLYGIKYGFIVGIAYMLVVILGGRPAQQQGRLRWSGTDTPAILLIGLVIAIVSTPGYGIIYILIAVLGGRDPLQRGRLRWSRATTPPTLLTGLMAGLGVGLVYGLTSGPTSWLGLMPGLIGGLLLGLRQPSTEATSPLDPRSLWRRERQFGLVVGLAVSFGLGLAVGLGVGLIFGPSMGIVYGITEGLVAGIGSGLVSSATWTAALADAQLWHRDEAPVRLLRFLEDARQRQILRTVGPTYQFRHARLQDRLAEAREPMPGQTAQPSLPS